MFQLLIETSALNNGLNTFFMQLETKSSTNINLNTASIFVTQGETAEHNILFTFLWILVYCSFHNSL